MKILKPFVFILLSGLAALSSCKDDEAAVPQYKLEATTTGQGTITISPEQETYAEGTEVTLTATPAQGYKFTGWSGDVTSTDNPIKVAIDGDKSLTANFSQIPTYTLSLNTSGNGTTNVSPASASYSEGTEVTITATPDYGWKFSGWSGDVTSSDNPLSLSMDGNKNITATFTAIPTYTLNVGTISQGTVKVEPLQDYYLEGTQVTLTAIPNQHYDFFQWKGAISSTENSLTITMNSNMQLSAEFKGKPLIIDDNGITIKVFAGVVGESYELNGQMYKVVDETMLRAMVANNEDVTKVVTTRVKNMEYLFVSKTDFNQDISTWDTEWVTSMHGTFNNATSFNQDISAWNVRNVVFMINMFNRASSFNQNINSWDVSKVANMRGMFYLAESFNQDLNDWNVSKVNDMYTMFNQATAFNGNISNWNVSNVKNMTGMFGHAVSFNQPLANWNVGNVTTMSVMFTNASSFNQDISNWNTENVTDMYKLFLNATAFNQNISSWNVAKVTQMREMFHNATSFNQDLSSWNVSNVTACYQFALNATAWNLPKPSLTCIQ